MNQWIQGSLHGWTCEGRVMQRLHTEDQRLGDTDWWSSLFCLACRRPSPTLDIPGHALRWRVLFAFCYQSVGIVPDCTLQQEWHQYTPTMSVSSLVLIRCIMTASARLMSLKGNDVCLILTAAFMDGNNGVHLNSSFFLFPQWEQPSSSRYLQPHVVAIWW